MAYIKDGMYCSDDRREEENKDTCCAPQHPRPKKILLECGFAPKEACFEVCDEKGGREKEFVLDRVRVDTSCLLRPLTKLEFSSLVSFEAEQDCFSLHGLEVELLFELERVCFGHRELLQSWKYEFELETMDPKLEVEISQPFTVTFCDRSCPSCCEYKMTVKLIKLEGKFKELHVTKSELSALAQGECGD